jgi:hypothetical protein
MRKSSQQIEVEVVGDVIHIIQRDPTQNHDDTVVVSPDQVVLLIEWLRDARDKIRGETHG